MIVTITRLKYLSFIVLVVWLTCVVPPVFPAEINDGIIRCSDIEDDLLRLQCYDEMAGRKPLPVKELDTCAVVPPKKLSYLDRLWEAEQDPARGKFAIKMHRSNYLLPFSYNFSPNREPFKEVFPDRDLYKAEAAFQISFKTKLWEDVLGGNMDLWVGYTQRSFWQVYNVDESAPFRDTNYEPELLLNIPMNLNLRLMTLKTINFGLNHQSNGRSEPLSRSWNRIVANFGFEHNGLFLEDDSLVLEFKTWYRIPESDSSDDNPDMHQYLGYGEIWASYFKDKHRFAMMVRNNLESNDNHGALQLEWSFPLNDHIGGYIQYFLGYGESLIDYNHSVNRVGVGFILMDWE